MFPHDMMWPPMQEPTCTLDPAKNGGVSLSNGDLTAACVTGGSTYVSVAGTVGVLGGAYYFEFDNTPQNGGDMQVSVGQWAGGVTTVATYSGGGLGGAPYNIPILGGNVGVAASVWGLAVDLNRMLAWYSRSGGGWTGAGGAAGDPVAGANGISLAGLNPGPWFPIVSISNSSTVKLNFGTAPFTFTPPAGFGFWGG